MGRKCNVSVRERARFGAVILCPHACFRSSTQRMLVSPHVLAATLKHRRAKAETGKQRADVPAAALLLHSELDYFKSARTKAEKRTAQRRPAVACRVLPVSRNHSLCCLDFHGVGVRHATRSAFKDILDIKVTKSRRSSERHNSSAAWATRRHWRVISRMFIAHGRTPAPPSRRPRTDAVF